MGPYFLSSDMTVLEKMNEKTTAMPSQQTPVATAGGSRSRHETLPASRSHTVNDRKAVKAARPRTPSSTGPPASRSAGPAQPAKTEQPTSAPSQMSRRGMSFIPRGSRSKARSYSPCTAVAAAIPPSLATSSRKSRSSDGLLCVSMGPDGSVFSCPPSLSLLPGCLSGCFPPVGRDGRV